MATVKKDRPWWGVGHTLWGGETFKCKKKATNLGIKNGDTFRIERDLAGQVTLVPHPDNGGTWNEFHGQTNPILLNPLVTTVPGQERAYSMLVKIAEDAETKMLYFIEYTDGEIAISDSATNPGTDETTVSVER
jgi:hypothetical protein